MPSSPARLGRYMTATKTSMTLGGHPLWRILDTRGNQLATAEWYARWNQYVLAPNAGSVFNDGCLTEVIKFLRALTAEVKAGAAVSDG